MKHLIAAILIGAFATIGAAIMDDTTARAVVLIGSAAAVYLLHQLETEDRAGRTSGRK